MKEIHTMTSLFLLFGLMALMDLSKILSAAFSSLFTTSGVSSTVPESFLDSFLPLASYVL
jgi:hypothetical protein